MREENQSYELREINEKCGVFAVSLKDWSKNSRLIPQLIHIGLSRLQNRGQTGAGFLTYRRLTQGRGKSIDGLKGSGTVYKLFGGGNNSVREKIYNEGAGVSAIGHTRYGTFGFRESDEDYDQPFYRRHGRNTKRFGMAYNGNLPDPSELEKKILGTGYRLDTDVDTEIIMHWFSLWLKKLHDKSEESFDFFELAKNTMPEMDGAYNLVFLFGDGKIGIIRDQQGFHCLKYGENKLIRAVASERTALLSIGINEKNIWNIPPGYAGIIDESGAKYDEIIPAIPSHCFFEGIYFSNVASDFEGKSIYYIRKNTGDELYLGESKEFLNHINKNRDKCAVVAPPNTPDDAASQYAYRANLPFRRGIIKIATLDQPPRGFINPRDERSMIMSSIYEIIPEIFNDNIIIIIEDTIVRAETLKKLLSKIRERSSPRELHVRVTAPPIIGPCFYAIDMSTTGELIANQIQYSGTTELEIKLARELGVNSLRYQTHHGLDSSFGYEFKGKLCKACLTREYPTPAGIRMADIEFRRWKNSREYEFYKFADGI